jgi:hypothetical protein
MAGAGQLLVDAPPSGFEGASRVQDTGDAIAASSAIFNAWLGLGPLRLTFR